MAFINPALLAQPVPTVEDMRGQRVTNDAREAQAKSFDLANISAEEKIELEKDIKDLNRGVALAKAGFTEEAGQIFTGSGDELLTGLWEKISTEGFNEQTESFIGEIRNSLGQVGVKVPTTRILSAEEAKSLGFPDGAVVEEKSDNGVATNYEMLHTPKAAQPQNQFTVIPPEEARSLGLPEGGVFQRDSNNKISKVFEPPQASEAGDVRSRKINDLMRVHSLSEGQAINLVDGHTRTEINPNTGAAVTLNEVANTASEVPLAQESQPSPEPKAGQTLYDLAEVATGPINTVTAKGAAAASFFGIQSDEPATEAQQVFSTETQNMIRALAINPRFPVGEMERIKQEISVEPSFFTGVGTLRKKMKGLDASLRLRLEQAERDANDVNLDQATRQAQKSNASALRNFLSIMGVPQGELEGDALSAEIEKLEQELGL